MAQITDWPIPTGPSGLAMRQQVNLITEALRTCNSGATAPTPTVAGMLWYDNSATPGILYQRNNANDAWVPIAAADGSVTNAKLADVATETMKGRIAAGTGAPQDLTVAEVQTLLGIDGASGFVIGDTITSARALASPEWLPSDGAVYLQSSYPALFAELGIVGVFNPGLKLSDPATLPAGTGNGTAFSPDGTYLSVAHISSPFVTIYKRSGDVFTKLANPAALPANQGTGTAFSPDGTYLSVAHRDSPFVTIYKRSGDVFTKLANPAARPPNTANGTAFSTDGTYLSVAHQDSPFVTIYKSTNYDKATSFAVTNSPGVKLPLKTFIKAT